MQVLLNSLFGALLAIASLGGGAALAADIYRWTDENGLVHFGERPPRAGGERIELRQQSGRPEDADAGAADRRERQQRLLDAYTHERSRKKQQQAEVEAEEARNRRRCAALERHWRSLSWGGPVYYGQEDGARVYLSEAERNAEKRTVRQAYEASCRGRLE
jgi:hypothetical protein